MKSRQIEGQLTIDDYAVQPAARDSDPSTSKAAALLPGRSVTKRRVLHALRQIRAGTDEQIAEKAGMEKGSTAKRRGDLVSEGFIKHYEIEGVPFVARTRSGCPAHVWEPTAAGWEVDLNAH